jgi:hypothetical protein
VIVYPLCRASGYSEDGTINLWLERCRSRLSGWGRLETIHTASTNFYNLQNAPATRHGGLIHDGGRNCLRDNVYAAIAARAQCSIAALVIAPEWRAIS